MANYGFSYFDKIFSAHYKLRPCNLSPCTTSSNAWLSSQMPTENVGRWIIGYDTTDNITDIISVICLWKRKSSEKISWVSLKPGLVRSIDLVFLRHKLMHICSTKSTLILSNLKMSDKPMSIPTHITTHRWFRIESSQFLKSLSIKIRVKLFDLFLTALNPK